MATLTLGTAPYVADQTIGVLAFDEFIQASPIMPALYNQMGSNLSQEERQSVSGIQDFTEKTELQEPDEDTPTQQFRKVYIHKEYALQVKVERKVIDYDQFSFFAKLGQKIGLSAVRTMETLAAKQFNEAFASSSYLGEDDLTLCNAAHVNAASGNSQSNTGTSAMSAANIGSTRASMHAFTDYDGYDIVVEPDLLLFSSKGTLEDTAIEIVKSALDPSTANNKVNPQQGRYSYIAWDKITDTNNWFLIDSRLMKMNLAWFWSAVLEIFGDGELMKGKRSIGGYFRSSHGVSDWRWIYGQNVA